MGAGIVSVVSQEGAKHERDGWPCRCRFALVVALIFGLAAVVLQGCSEARNQNLGESLPSARPGQGVWVLGASGDVRSSTDGGVSWRASRLPGDKLHRAKAIAFTDPAHGWIVVLGGVARSVDGGATWLPALRSPVQAGGPATNYGLFAVASSDAGHAWVVGHQGKDDSLILATSDGGRAWREQRLGAAVALWTVSFVNSRHGWVTGKSMSGGPSFVFATRDGGRTWHQQLRSNHSLSGAAFADSRHGWVVGSSDPTGGREGGAILATSDGGASWQTQLEGDVPPLMAVACTDADHAWAVGADGAILATSDGGASWTRQKSDTDQPLGAVAFASVLDGWVAGRTTALLTTTYGGASWTRVELDTAIHGDSWIDVATLARE